MTIVNKQEPIILLLGDIISLYISLWLMFFIRYFQIPTEDIINTHLLPFSILFLVWIVFFFIAGLYERHTSLVRRSLPSTLLKTQIINSVIAVLFFYFIPSFGITPKTNLFIYILVSLGILLLWRLVVFKLFFPKKKSKALLIGRGEEMKELREEINVSKYYGYKIAHSVNLDSIESVDLKEDIVDEIYTNDIDMIIIDTKDDAVLPLLPHLYNLMFSNITFVDMHEIYEDIFGKVPLSLVKHGWFLENVRSKPHIMYDALKRLMDIFISFILGILTLIFYPIALILMIFNKDDRGPLFYVDKRIGRNNSDIQIFKFRSMHQNKVTKAGYFLRRSRIDELPQLWNVLKGDLSLIGPRPEQPALGKIYGKEVPYYNIRHLIKPGLSGWAQMRQENHPHHEADVEETKNKLSYDLYYIKNRSLLLDLKIALQTIKTLLSREGR